ncbi:RidA family protein [Albibacillus kandeliae]|uniref:RidA family protein n=1 Tax=Albibacillus kandeliae TaxID=2174228 RepID=UPI000D68FDC1|nr:RidA family protein [Albibacillus kandeliae]
MKEEITGGLPPAPQPFSWGIRANGLLYTTHGPITAEGAILKGDITAQAELTFQNMRAVLEEAGGTLDDIVQVQIFLLDVADMKPVDEVYKRYFSAPYPNRASLVVAALVAEGMRIEVTAIADLTLSASGTAG